MAQRFSTKSSAVTGTGVDATGAGAVLERRAWIKLVKSGAGAVPGVPVGGIEGRDCTW